MDCGTSNREFERLLAFHADEVAAGRSRLKIPRLGGAMLPGGGRHFHFTPEVFIQTGGWTDFDCPAERFRLKAGEIAVIPIGIPHGEKARAWRGPFRNIVVLHAPDSVAWHTATASDRGTPRGSGVTVIQAPDAVRLVGYLNDLVDAHNTAGVGRDGLMRGLFLAYLSHLRNLVAGTVSGRRRYSHKVEQARHWVLKRLSDTKLSVRQVAGGLGCSADYLSNLFRRETGQKLIAFIQRQRVDQARGLLESSTMSVKEIGLAVGYNDPGYFIRVFKRVTGQTPAACRRLGAR